MDGYDYELASEIEQQEVRLWRCVSNRIPTERLIRWKEDREDVQFLAEAGLLGSMQPTEEMRARRLVCRYAVQAAEAVMLRRAREAARRERAILRARRRAEGRAEKEWKKKARETLARMEAMMDIGRRAAGVAVMRAPQILDAVEDLERWLEAWKIPWTH